MNKLRGECEVTIDEKPVGLLFNVYTFFLFCEEMGVELDDMESALSKPTSMGVLLWAALETKAKSLKKKNKYTVVDTPELIMSLSQDDQVKLIETLEMSIKAISGESSNEESSDKKK